MPGSSIDYAHQIGIKYSFGIELRDKGRYYFCLPEDQIIPTGEENLAGLITITKHAFNFSKKDMLSAGISTVHQVNATMLLIIGFYAMWTSIIYKINTNIN